MEMVNGSASAPQVDARPYAGLDVTDGHFHRVRDVGDAVDGCGEDDAAGYGCCKIGISPVLCDQDRPGG